MRRRWPLVALTLVLALLFGPAVASAGFVREPGTASALALLGGGTRIADRSLGIRSASGSESPEAAPAPGFRLALRRDRVGAAGVVDGPNLYRWNRSNPLRYVDPDGLEPYDPAAHLGGGGSFSGDRGRPLTRDEFANFAAFAAGTGAGLVVAPATFGGALAWGAAAGLTEEVVRLGIAKGRLPTAGEAVSAAGFGAFGGGASHGLAKCVTRFGRQGVTGARTLSGLDWDAAETAYDAIRAADDVGAIAANTGLRESWIRRIKDHVFNRVHDLDDSVRRFDADPYIVNAWNRLREGTHNLNDLALLAHEYFESRFEGIFRAKYRAAHKAAIDSGRSWKWEP